MNTDRDKILVAASNGNGAALEFLRVFARRAHWVDDLRDEPAAHTCHDTLTAMEAEWLVMITSNPFFLAHRGSLVPAMLLGLNAWADSEKQVQGFGGTAPRWNKDTAAVVKGIWHEVVWLVAFLTGGWDKMRAVSSAHREYDFENSEVRIPNSELREEANGTLR